MTNFDLVMQNMTAEKLANVDVYICDKNSKRHCNKHINMNCYQCRLDWLKREAEATQSSPIPTIEEVKTAATIIRDFCDSRVSNSIADCMDCPIRYMCNSDPYTWEIR